MKLLTEAQHAALLDFVMQYDKHAAKLVPDIGTPVKNISIELNDFDTESDAPFTYTQEHIIIEGYINGNIIINVIRDLFSINCDGDLIDSDILDIITITQQGTIE